MGGNFVIGLDLGQTTVKAAVFDERMGLRSVGRVSSPVETPRPRYAERSQQALWAAVESAIRKVFSESGISPEDVRAVSVAGHGDGLHLVDAAGEPVAPAITAMDTRGYLIRDRILESPERLETIVRLSGQGPALGSPGVLLAWMLEHEPERVERAAWQLSCKDVVRFRLTGEIATDYSDASASFLDVGSARWSPEIMAAYGLQGLEHLNPPVRGGGEVAGRVTRAAADATGLKTGTPVVMGVHDVQAASIGMGALIEDRLALVSGSFSTNGVTTRRTDVDARWHARLSVTPDLRIAMTSSPTASPTLSWVLGILGIEGEQQRDRLFAEAAELDEAAAVPLVLPYVLSSPLGPDASAAMLGLRQWQSRAHLLKGALEGIALMHYWHTRILADRFTWEVPIALSGGISRSPLYARMVAGAMDAPIAVVDNEEAGAWGAAALAWTATGGFGSLEEAQELVPRSAVITPTAEGYWAERRAAFDEANSSLEPWWSGRAAREEGGR